MTEIKTKYSNTLYLILDGSKTVDKVSFLNELELLLHFPDYSDEYGTFVWDWDEFTKHLNSIVTIWENENPNYIEPVSDEHGVLPKDLIVNVIWLHPLNFSIYNSADFLTALDILKSVNEDENNPLTFLLAGDVSSINTELYK